MTTCLYILHVDDGICQTSLFSDDKAALTTFGHDHHRAARIVPVPTHGDHHSKVLAMMDEYKTDWTEHVAEPGT